MSPKPPIVFRRIGQPAPPPKGGAPAKKPITPLEQTILHNNGGKLDVLPVPEKAEDAFIFQAQKMAQVEHLMFQGIRTPHLIAQATNITEQAAEKYVKAVIARWQTTGGDVDMKTQRGEALRYMDFLQNQLWTQFQAAKKIVDDNNKLAADKKDYRAIGSAQARMLNLNNQIIALNQQRNQIYGLTPQAIQQMLVLGGNEDAEVLTRMRKQEGMKQLAAKFASILDRNRGAKVIEGRVIEG